jgi:3-oxoadipate enol-lactonase
MPWAQLPGITLYYERRGAGRQVLFLGGTGGDLRRPANPFDRALAREFELLVFDQRGMGRSDKPDAPCTMADYAGDAAALLGHVGWTRVAVLGYSFGGMVAQELALRHPQRVERLVLLSTTAGGAGGSSFPLHELQDLDPHAKAVRMIELGDTRRDAAWRAANPALFDALVAEAEAGLRLADDAAGRAGAARQLAARRGHDTWERLPALCLPVWVFAGEHDGIAPPAAQEKLARRIAGARFERFAGGHLFFLQDSAACPAIAAALRGA